MSSVDRPIAVRAGEEIDPLALSNWLSLNLPQIAQPVEVSQFPSGHSNLTYLLRGQDDREWVLRRPPFGARVKRGHDMGREFDVLAKLSGVFAEAPTPLALCTDAEVLGADFYIMECVAGMILRGPNPKGVELDPTLMASVCESLIKTLVEIHAVDIQTTGLHALGKPEGYVGRQVEGWTRRYANAKTDDIPEMQTIATWLAEYQVPELAPTLIHNDFKYDNLVLNPADLSQVISVLDWEMATVGDPLMDLGTVLAYWLEPSDSPLLQAISGPTTLKGNLSRRELADRYAALSGRSVDDILFYYVYGLFKVAVIGQQIYFRFKAGHTSDPRFAGLIFAVRALSERAVTAIQTGQI